MHFDPFVYLNLTFLSEKQKENLRLPLMYDIYLYILERFSDELSPNKSAEIEKKLPELKTFEQINNLIKEYGPEFDGKKQSYLEEYKKYFHLDKFIEFINKNYG